MKILCIHAHFDDFEFVASGTFELWRRRLGSKLSAKVIVCTDGKAGHHFRTREETGSLRLKEQAASAQAGKYLFEVLKYPNGEAPREGCLEVEKNLLAALWKAIRDFEPDYLFCPPLPSDPLMGIHVDHVAVAEAVRKVAYMINVPHAFTPEYPANETRSKSCKTPVILNLHDAYFSGKNSFDFAVNVESAFQVIADESWCHQSQICEWLPWIGRHRLDPPASKKEWAGILRRRLVRRQRQAGLKARPLVELFTVTVWGAIPAFQQLEEDFPPLLKSPRLRTLKRRLLQWSKS